MPNNIDVTDKQIRELRKSVQGKAPITAWCDEALGEASYQRGHRDGFARARCASIINGTAGDNPDHTLAPAATPLLEDSGAGLQRGTEGHTLYCPRGCCDTGQDFGNGGRDGERGERGHRGPRGPQGPAAPLVPFVPPFPAVVPTIITIFARQTGSDVTGTGSFEEPFRTFQRAIRQVPNVIAPGFAYIVDVTNLGDVHK